MKKGELIGGVVVFLFGGLTTLFSLTMPIGTFRMAGTGLFPLLLGVLLMGLSLLFLITPFYGPKFRPTQAEGPPQAPRSTNQMMRFLGVMALATLFLERLGYPLTSFLLLLFLLRTLGIKRWLFIIMLSLAAAMGSYLLFVQWLKIPLPKGFIDL